MEVDISHILKRVLAIACTTLALTAVAALVIAPTGAVEASSADPEPQPEANAQVRTSGTSADRRGHADDRAITVAPGRVSFTMAPDGRWLGFGERGGRVFVETGGFVVLARNADGDVVTVVDTRRGGMKPLEGYDRIGVVKEGDRGGARFPSANPDDDGDGLIDEDRLDGIDNDGDGLIDEDFAAIGDAMIVAGYQIDSDADHEYRISLHQECYAWSLAHIDGMVAMKLTVRNNGDTPIEGVRVGAVFERDRNTDVSTESMGTGEMDAFGFDRPFSAKSMTFTDGDRPALAAIFASEGTHDETSWLTGVVPGDRPLADVVRAADRPDALARPDGRFRGNAFDDDDTPATRAASTSTLIAYGISPELGTIEPGEEVELYFALIVIDDVGRASRIVEDAFRTIRGDNGHRMIPPPMSITRRTVFGSYELRVPHDPSAGMTLTIVNPRARGINPAHISRMQGLDLHGATRTEAPNGDVVFEFSGELPEKMAERKRVVLSGQTRDGEMFNAVLQPIGAPGEASVEAATRFWNTGGKLDESLLSGSPNPFRIATTISYEVPTRLVDEMGAEIEFTGMVSASVKVYNVTGRLVSTLADATLGPGRYDVQWNASNETGQGVASGVYYVKLQLGNRHITKRLIQLK